MVCFLYGLERLICQNQKRWLLSNALERVVKLSLYFFQNIRHFAVFSRRLQSYPGMIHKKFIIWIKIVVIYFKYVFSTVIKLCLA